MEVPTVSTPRKRSWSLKVINTSGYTHCLTTQQNGSIENACVS
ncbi:hypothetical protein IC582_026416 [Cucumis melo]